MIILTGPAGSGKDTVAAKLIDKGYKRVIEVTTRERRTTEKNGREYYFVDDTEFESLLVGQHFAVYHTFDRVQQGKEVKVHYGILKQSLQDKDQHLILSTNPATAMDIAKLRYDNLFFVELLITKDTQKLRLLQRGDELGEINKRMKSDWELHDNPHWADKVIINEDRTIESTVEEVEKLYREFLEEHK